MGKKADPVMMAAMAEEAVNPSIGMFDNFAPASVEYGAPVNMRQTANIHGYEGAMEGIPDMTEYMSEYMRLPADPATMTPESVQGVIPQPQSPSQGVETPALKVRPQYSYSPTVVQPSEIPGAPAQAGTGPTPTSDFKSAEMVAALKAEEDAAAAAAAQAAADKAAADKAAADAAAAEAAKDSTESSGYAYGSLKNVGGDANDYDRVNGKFYAKDSSGNYREEKGGGGR